MNSDSLLSINNEDFNLVISGPKPSLNSVALKKFQGGTLRNENKFNGLINITHLNSIGETPILRVETKTSKFNKDNTSIEVTTNISSEEGEKVYLPIFFENIDYELFFVYTSEDADYTIWHEHSSINKNIKNFKKHKTITSRFNFRNNVGLSSFEIKERGKAVLKLTFSVFSLKLDYLSDRYYMINDLKKLHNNLLNELFNPTKTNADTILERASGTEWLVNFYKVSEDLLSTLRRIEHKAHNKIASEKRLQRVDKVKKPSKKLNNLINKFGKHDILRRNTVVIEHKITDLNTAENQYIKFLILYLINSVEKWTSFIITSESKSLKAIQDEHFFKLIQINSRKLKKISKNRFWSLIEANKENLKNKTNFMFHDEFIKFEKLVKLVKRALLLQEKGNNHIYTLPMDKLYEMWSFCKISQVIGSLVHGNNNQLVLKVSTNAFRTFLEMGQVSKVKVSNDISISTNRLFNTTRNGNYFSPFVSQKPDIVLEIKSKKQLNLMDAKYKIDVVLKKEENEFSSLNSKDLVSRDLSEVPLENIFYRPKDEDINTMHRYRDAILITNNTNDLERAVNRGMILYPRRITKVEEEAINNYIQKMVDYKIGAIPLAPGEEDVHWLLNYSTDLIPDKPEDNEQIRIIARLINLMLSEGKDPEV